jgi:DNA-binding NarL/FixJ family response regulator
VILCDWTLNPIFTNREGMSACWRWKHGRQSTSRSRTDLPARLPAEIADLAVRFKKTWATAREEAQKISLLAPRSVSSPTDKKLTALVQVVRSKQHPLSEPLLLIQFVDVHTSQEWLDRHSLQRNLHLEKLTSREQDVARLVLCGMGNRTISHELGKSLATVKAQLTSTYRKLCVRNRAGLLVLLR